MSMIHEHWFSSCQIDPLLINIIISFFLKTYIVFKNEIRELHDVVKGHLENRQCYYTYATSR